MESLYTFIPHFILCSFTLAVMVLTVVLSPGFMDNVK